MLLAWGEFTSERRDIGPDKSSLLCWVWSTWMPTSSWASRCLQWYRSRFRSGRVQLPPVNPLAHRWRLATPTDHLHLAWLVWTHFSFISLTSTIWTCFQEKLPSNLLTQSKYSNCHQTSTTCFNTGRLIPFRCPHNPDLTWLTHNLTTSGLFCFWWSRRSSGVDFLFWA